MLEIMNSNKAKLYVSDDPVRPHIDYDFRVSENRKMFSLLNEENRVRAIICTSFNPTVPTSESDLSIPGNDVVTFYTVWSYDKGAGREIVFSVRDWVKFNLPNVKRFVTLSPPTEMARRFHTKNGAIELSNNGDTINFEYT